MKRLFALVFMASSISFAAIPIEKNPEYVAPADNITTMDGRMTICRSSGPHGGQGLSFLQTGEGQCAPEARTAEGWDRPAYEMNSPGMPFKNQGLE